MKKEVIPNQVCEEMILSFAPLHMTISNDPEHDPSIEGFDSMYYIQLEKGIHIYDNGDVMLSFYAPEAEKVEVCGNGGAFGDTRYPLTKDPDGYFRRTFKDIPDGFHLLKFFVDDVQLVNPDMPIGYGTFVPINFLEKPAPDSEFFYIKDVPHGSVRMELYPSSVTGRMKCCYVYTPPGYDTSDKKYPVVYLQHGATENETDWVWLGKVNFILDNLLSEGKCEEMLVVMNCGYGFVGEESPVFLPGDFDRELVSDCIPYIDGKYRTITDRRGRAAAGLSLGSAQAFYAAMAHRDVFASLGMFSGGLPLIRYDYDYSAFFEDGRQVNDNFDLLYMGVGEQEDFYQHTLDCCRMLDERKISYRFYSCPGYHEWDVWKRCFHDFAQYVFRGVRG